MEGPKSIRATLGPCEEGRRGVSGGKGDRSGGKKGGPVSPDKGTDGPKVMGKMGMGNNIGEEMETGKTGYHRRWRPRACRSPVRGRWGGLGKE